MTLPPTPPPDPLGGMPGGDPLGPVPGNEPPSDSPDRDPVAVPEQRAHPDPQPETQPWQRPDPQPWEQPEPAGPHTVPPPNPRPAPELTPAQARSKTKIRNGLISLTVIFALMLCGGVFSLANSFLSSDDEEASAPMPEAPQESPLAAEDHFSEEFELPAEIAGSPNVDRLDAWDHDDCTDIATEDAVDTALPDAGCEYAIEGAYEREDLDMALSQYVLVFDDEDKAADAAEQFDPDSLAEDVSFSSDAGDAARAGLVDAVNEFVVLTVGEVESEDNAEDASDVIGYFHVESGNALRFTF